jgi:hypothetical protein
MKLCDAHRAMPPECLPAESCGSESIPTRSDLRLIAEIWGTQLADSLIADPLGQPVTRRRRSLPHPSSSGPRSMALRAFSSPAPTSRGMSK